MAEIFAPDVAKRLSNGANALNEERDRAQRDELTRLRETRRLAVDDLIATEFGSDEEVNATEVALENHLRATLTPEERARIEKEPS